MIKVYSGTKVKGSFSHPALEVIKAKKIVKQGEGVVHTNSPEMVSGLYYIAIAEGIDIKLYLDGKKATIEDVFKDLNRCYDLLDRWGATDEQIDEYERTE